MIFVISGIFLSLSVIAPAFAQPAKDLIEKECSRCHNLDRVKKANKDKAAWEKTVDRMIKKGANIKPEEKDTVIKYLNTLNK
jgi:cytochrome c5